MANVESSESEDEFEPTPEEEPIYQALADRYYQLRPLLLWLKSQEEEKEIVRAGQAPSSFDQVISAWRELIEWVDSLLVQPLRPAFREELLTLRYQFSSQVDRFQRQFQEGKIWINILANRKSLPDPPEERSSDQRE